MIALSEPAGSLEVKFDLPRFLVCNVFVFMHSKHKHMHIKGEVFIPPLQCIGSELGKLRQVSIGNFHRNDQKLVKSSF